MPEPELTANELERAVRLAKHVVALGPGGSPGHTADMLAEGLLAALAALAVAEQKRDRWEKAARDAVMHKEAAEVALSEMREAASEVARAHEAVINGATPTHPDWCADDHEKYNARFSAWHVASRKLRTVLSPSSKDRA